MFSSIHFLLSEEEMFYDLQYAGNGQILNWARGFDIY